MAITSAPLDFVGVNYYFREHWRAAPYEVADPAVRPANDIGADKVRPAGVSDYTESGWPVEPAGLTEVLTALAERYPDIPPVYVTENGRACPDVPGDDGVVDDRDRIAFVAAHLHALHDAMDQGVDVRGYYHWSLLDNFEWAEGYAKRFGLVYVDYPTGRRVPKAAYHWFREQLTARHGDGAR
jgi:beta-glucosidase